MTAFLAPGIVWLTALAPLAPPAATDCGPLVQHILSRMDDIPIVMEPESVLGSLLGQGVSALDRCPQEEGLWYALLHLLEVENRPARGSVPARLAGEPVADFATAVERAMARFPRSVRIATVRARIAGTLEAARAAYAIDPKYGPARVALAEALLHAGDLEAARRLLTETPQLERIYRGYLVLGRVMLAAGDAPGALKALHQQAAPRAAGYFVEVQPFDLEREMLDAEGETLLACGRIKAGLRTLLLAEKWGSPTARAILDAKRTDPKTARLLRGMSRHLPK